MRKTIFLTVVFLAAVSVLFLKEEVAADPSPNTASPIYSKLTDVEKRLDALEKKQEKLLDLQQQILVEIERLRIRIRKT